MWRNTYHRGLFQGLTAIGLAGLAAAGLAWSRPPTPMKSHCQGALIGKRAMQSGDDPAIESLPGQEPAFYDRVRRMCRGAALTSHDLAALCLDTEQAGEVLSRLLDWTLTHQADMIAADNRAESARQALVSHVRRVRVGEESDDAGSELTRLQRDVYAAESDCRAWCLKAGEYATATLPNNAARQWRQAAGHLGLPVGLRHVPGLSRLNREALLQAIASEAGPPASDVAAVQNATGLSHSVAAQLRQVHADIQAHLPGVRAAERRLFPQPTPIDDASGFWPDESDND